MSSPEKIEMPNTKEKLLSKLKKLAWRSTGLYVWAHFLTAILGGSESLAQGERWLFERLLFVLSSFGLAPNNAVWLPRFLKFIWVLVITGFKPGMVALLILYLLTFPIILPLYWFITRASEETSSSGIEKKNYETIAKNRSLSRGALYSHLSSIPWTFVWMILLGGWYVLYGDPITRRQVIIGSIFSGLLWFAFSLKTFQWAQPSAGGLFLSFGWFKKYGESFVSNTLKTALESEGKGETKVKIEAQIMKTWRNVCFRFALFTKGKKAQLRASAVVFLQYILSMIVTGFSAVLFWALATKAIAPESLSLPICIHLSVSHFLPSIPRPNGTPTLPLWSSIGPAATFWITFVLFIGPAGSIFPTRQTLYMERIREIHQELRRYALKFRTQQRKLERILLEHKRQSENM